MKISLTNAYSVPISLVLLMVGSSMLGCGPSTSNRSEADPTTNGTEIQWKGVTSGYHSTTHEQQQ